MKEKETRNIAKSIIGFYLGEAWNDLENSYYDFLQPYEKEMIKFYIHFYGQKASRMMKVPYESH